MYHFYFDGSKSEVSRVKKSCEGLNRSKEFWKMFSSKVCAGLDSEYPAQNRVNFITVIRTDKDKVLTFNGSSFVLESCVPMEDHMSSFNDHCLVNAFSSYTSYMTGPKDILSLNSTPQILGVIQNKGKLYVYMNVIVSEYLLELAHKGSIVLNNGSSFALISNVFPNKDSIESKLLDSLVIVGG